ncbi:MAG: conserved phage C-terminal domain-containing protein [Oscillospiraceae bacterium]|nr:conserved phage C-terminal domain-containing protein [Oscillospiraceae bacterium]
MIEIVDGVITITNWEKHQNIDGMDKIREQNRDRQKKWYDQQKTKKTTTPTPPPDPPKPDEDSDTVAAIVAYLNEKAGTNYRTNGARKTKSLIRARLREGFTEDDFRTVIDHKCGEWLGDPKMRGFLRPETLFDTKFESYLNAAALRPAPENTKSSSFETDEFMLAALRKSYGG